MKEGIVMRISVATGLVLALLSLPTQNAAAQFTEKKVLTLAAAQKMVAAAQAEAERQHLAGVIAVVDDGGWPILILRMDNAAYVASVELAPGKARTAALFKKPSQALGACPDYRSGEAKTRSAAGRDLALSRPLAVR
jgi:glc operon protein GlcG